MEPPSILVAYRGAILEHSTALRWARSMIRRALEPSAGLWANGKAAVKGYASPNSVPIVQKEVTAVELLAQAEATQEEDDPED